MYTEIIPYPSYIYTKEFQDFTNDHREEIDSAITQAIIQTIGIPKPEPKKRKYDLIWR